MLAARLYGPFWGAVAAAVATGSTVVAWGHGWAVVVLVAEAAVVGWLNTRRLAQPAARRRSFLVPRRHAAGGDLLWAAARLGVLEHPAAGAQVHRQRHLRRPDRQSAAHPHALRAAGDRQAQRVAAPGALQPDGRGRAVADPSRARPRLAPGDAPPGAGPAGAGRDLRGGARRARLDLAQPQSRRRRRARPRDATARSRAQRRAAADGRAVAPGVPRVPHSLRARSARTGAGVPPRGRRARGADRGQRLRCSPLLPEPAPQRPANGHRGLHGAGRHRRTDGRDGGAGGRRRRHPRLTPSALSISTSWRPCCAGRFRRSCNRRPSATPAA